MEIMKHVDILELIKIDVYRPNIYEGGAFQVDLTPYDKTKVVVVDEDELVKLNAILTEKCREDFKDARDENVPKYIEEFVARMCSDWHRLGLLVIEDIPDAPSDPYAEAKKNVRH